MKAVLYDVHGNSRALAAVLADAQDAGAESYVLGGDYALFGALPAQTLDLLDPLDAVWIRGNTDRWLSGIDADDVPDSALIAGSIRFCRDALGAERSRKFDELPITADVDGALICHASPRSDVQSFALQPMDSDTELLEGTDQPVVVFGHTHLQFAREHQGRLLVNPGSVGLPLDGDARAAYALWRGGNEFELRRVPYDHASYASELRESMETTLGRNVETLVRRVEQAELVD